MPAYVLLWLDIPAMTYAVSLAASYSLAPTRVSYSPSPVANYGLASRTSTYGVRRVS